MHTDRTNVMFLSTYPPRECGIATFTQDLVDQFKNSDAVEPRVIAISDRETTYGSDVYDDFSQTSRYAHLGAAESINRSGADLLMVEHEYGIFGGENGEYLLSLLTRLNIPYLLTCHTVLPQPSHSQHRILADACRYASGVVVMSEYSKELLEGTYGVQPEKITKIHHGAPDIDVPARDTLKTYYGVQGCPVVSTFGLLGPGKGLEYAVEAIAKVSARHPDVQYFILGQTHPAIQRESGEAYRAKLEDMVEDLAVKDNVIFVDKYLSKEEIIAFLTMSDIYLTPYLSRNQAVSGTLAYATGCGRVVVSTPYLYAQEMLAEGRGLLARFGSAQSLADCMNMLLENPAIKDKMEENTLKLGKTLKWPNVAKEYERMFESVKRQGAIS